MQYHRTFPTALCSTFEYFGFNLFRTGPTCVSVTSTIDIMACTRDNLITSRDIIPALSSSDHFGLLASSTCCFVDYKKSVESCRKVWLYNSADYNLANDLLLDLNIADIIVPNDVNSSWENFSHQFLNIMDQYMKQTMAK